MRQRIRVRPPRGASESAVALSRELGVLRLARNDSRFVARWGDVIINWGNTALVPPSMARATWLNHPSSVARAVNKLETYDILRRQGVSTCEVTLDYDEALSWLADGSRVLHRTTVTGHAGEGITVHSQNGSKWTEEGLPAPSGAGVYVKVFGARPADVTEYRVHVVGEAVIDVQQKRRRRGNAEYTNPYVRTTKTGWVFCRANVELPEGLAAAVIRAHAGLRLDFAAYDVGVGGDGGGSCAPGRGEVCESERAYAIYECNTAPGIMGSTLLRYVNGIRSLSAGYERLGRANGGTAGTHSQSRGA